MHRQALNNKEGFTLLEVLVALVITGMTVAVFFQVLSAGLKLEFASMQRTVETVHVNQKFNAILAADVRDSNFEWEGEDNHGDWRLHIEQVDTEQTRAHSDDQLQVGSDLYRYVFEYQYHQGRKWTLLRYVQHETGFFDQDFKRRHFQYTQ
ncbi:prepilin-type N-terminal cleavage/methylation domain-containing protein [Desulfonatronospira sp.]|uniref:type IV pilus modification PilV family protein n=1 Tax=Desulfonatronospira sp. TaxID=1962951 RepID=UPI0025C48FE0|nr:prepilin-type N-terminal cleavage/methylation domain-containing protein [Desulfonatronospira sp.]